MVVNEVLDNYLDLHKRHDELRLMGYDNSCSEIQDINGSCQALYPQIQALAVKNTGRNDYCYCGSGKNVLAEIAITKQLNGAKPLRGETLSDEQFKSFLWSLSLEKELSMSTCSQAFHTLNFFYKTVLNRTFKERLLPRVLRADLSSELTCFYL